MSRKKKDNKIIGKNIQFLIDNDPNENKTTFADALGVHRRTVNRWTNGDVFPEEYLVDIADHFHVSLDTLLNFDMTFGTDLEGEERQDVIKSNFEQMVFIHNLSESFDRYVKAIGIEIEYEEIEVSDPDEESVKLPEYVTLSLDGKETKMTYADYGKLRDKISASIIKEMHLR